MKKFIVAFISERTGKQITTPWKLLFGAFAGLIGMIWDKIHWKRQIRFNKSWVIRQGRIIINILFYKGKHPLIHWILFAVGCKQVYFIYCYICITYLNTLSLMSSGWVPSFPWIVVLSFKQGLKQVLKLGAKRMNVGKSI